jgi:hypothetical protein
MKQCTLFKYIPSIYPTLVPPTKKAKLTMPAPGNTTWNANGR